MAVELPSWNNLNLHRGLGWALTVFSYAPGIHILGNVAEWRNFADFVQVLLAHSRYEILRGHSGSSCSCSSDRCAGHFVPVFQLAPKSRVQASAID